MDQSAESTTPLPPPPTPDPTPTSPPPPPPSDNVVTPPKIKWGKGKMIGALVILVLLVGGLITGIYLAQRQQKVPKSEAAGPASCRALTGTGCNCDNNGGVSCNAPSGGSVYKFVCDGDVSSCGGSAGTTPISESGPSLTESAGVGTPCNQTIQIDAYPLAQCRDGTGWICNNTTGFTIWYSGECPPGPTNTPVPPTPTPVAPACVSSTISAASINPGQSVTLTSTSTINANVFSYFVFNRDNLDAGGIPKSLCVASGGDITTDTAACPPGTHTLIFTDPNTTLRTTGSRTLAYNELFVADQNNGGTIPTQLQINSYFTITGDGTSHSDPNCVEFLAAAGAPTLTPTPVSPSPTPTITPTPPPGATPTPTSIAPSPTPVPLAQCQQVTVLSIVRGGAAVASPTLAKIQRGDVVTFRGFATATNATVTSINFTLTKGGAVQPVVQVTPTLVSGVYQANYVITIDQATSYSVTSAPIYQ